MYKMLALASVFFVIASTEFVHIKFNYGKIPDPNLIHKKMAEIIIIIHKKN